MLPSSSSVHSLSLSLSSFHFLLSFFSSSLFPFLPIFSFQFLSLFSLLFSSPLLSCLVLLHFLSSPFLFLSFPFLSFLFLFVSFRFFSSRLVSFLFFFLFFSFLFSLFFFTFLFFYPLCLFFSFGFFLSLSFSYFFCRHHHYVRTLVSGATLLSACFMSSILLVLFLKAIRREHRVFRYLVSYAQFKCRISRNLYMAFLNSVKSSSMQSLNNAIQILQTVNFVLLNPYFCIKHHPVRLQLFTFINIKPQKNYLN